MGGITELAQLLKQRENGAGYSPLLGRITSLPNLKVSLGDSITLSAEQIVRTFDVHVQSAGVYIYLNREVVLLPYADGQRFILIGVTL